MFLKLFLLRHPQFCFSVADPFSDGHLHNNAKISAHFCDSYLYIVFFYSNYFILKYFIVFLLCMPGLSMTQIRLGRLNLRHFCVIFRIRRGRPGRCRGPSSFDLPLAGLGPAPAPQSTGLFRPRRCPAASNPFG